MNIKELNDYCLKNNKFIIVRSGKLVGFCGERK